MLGAFVVHCVALSDDCINLDVEIKMFSFQRYVIICAIWR